MTFASPELRKSPTIPRMRKLSALIACAVLVVGCSPSGSSSNNQAASTVSAAPALTSDGTPPTAAPSVIVNHYDTATCADWHVTDSTNRKIVATYFLVRNNADDLAVSFEPAFQRAITVACAQVAPTITVSRVAKVSIPNLRSVIGQAGGS